MTDIINFLQHKNEREERLIEVCFQKAHSLDEKLDALLQHKSIQIEDHKLFLAFLKYIEQQQLDPQHLFRDVIQLPKHQFQQYYHMNWAQVVKLSVTFLTILKQNDASNYEYFKAMLVTR